MNKKIFSPNPALKKKKKRQVPVGNTEFRGVTYTGGGGGGGGGGESFVPDGGVTHT